MREKDIRSTSRTAGCPRRWLGEASGACGDLGSLLPYALGTVAVGAMSAAGIFLGFGLFLVATGLVYGLPLAVQPMKAIGALIVAGEFTPAEIALSGMVIGAVLVLGAWSGLLQRFARLVPGSVTAGLQLGLGAVMIALGLTMVLDAPLPGLFFLALLLGLMALPRVPAALVLVAIAAAIALPSAAFAPAALAFGLVSGPFDALHILGSGVLPQLSLTLTNAVIVTAAVARDLFPGHAALASERNLALSSGFANLLLPPFGAMPMCHGAGGLTAQYRFGARSGVAPVLLGAALIALALAFGEGLAGLLAALPIGAVGALLFVAGMDLALSRRVFDARPDCRPVIAATAFVTVAVNPALGFATGWAAEAVRSARARRRTA